MRTRTFLFADLRDYTRFVEHHGDAAAATLIGDYRRVVRAEVARAEGAEVKTEGDSFYVVFDSATSALRCGMAILREAERYSRERPDRPINVGIGIHAGEPESHQGQFVGEAVIVAARLAQQAGTGELLISEIARGLLARGAAPETTERTGLIVKGIDHPPRAFSVAWQETDEPAGLPQSARASVPGRPLEGGIVAARELVGRETELAALEAYVAEAAQGRGRLVLVAGEAGIGKSALMRHFIGAHGDDLIAYVGECSEIETGRPFGPVLDAFAAGGLDIPLDLRALGPGAQAAVEAERYVMHAALVGGLTARATERPVVLLLEDIHWADQATLELVAQLARRLPTSRVLVVATYRPEETHRDALDRALAQIGRSRRASEIRLRPLDEDGTARLVMSALGLDRAPTSEFRVAIHERCEGNPFFTEEVLRTLVERGELSYRDGHWSRERSVDLIDLPRTISAAVEQRLREVSAETLRVIRVAAVIGTRFDHDLLAGVGGFGEAEVISALSAAVAAQLILEEGASGVERYRFRHALTREVVLAGILRRERRSLHRAVARTIERRAASDPAAYAEELAYHFDEAGEVEPTIRYRTLAAERASRIGSYDSVQRHLERALELAPADHPDLDRLYLKLSRAAFNAAEHPRAEDAARAALRVSERRGRVLVQGAAATELARVAFAVGRRAERNAALARAIALLEPLGPSVELADAYVLQLSIAWFERAPDGVEIGRRALAMSERVGNLWGRTRALNMLGLVLFHTRGPESERDAVRHLRDSLELARRHEFVDLTERALTNLHSVVVDLGASAQECMKLREEMLEHAARYGYRSEEEWQLAFEAGDWDRSLEIVEEDAFSVSLFGAKRTLHGAIMRALRDGPASGLRLLERPREQLLGAEAPQWTRHAAAAGVVRYLGGDLAGTIADARLILGLPPEVYLEDALVAGLLAADELHDADARAVLADRARVQLSRARSGLSGDPRVAAFPVTFAAFAQGMEAEWRGDSVSALAAHERAAVAGAEWGRWFTVTQARIRRARMLAGAGDHESARAELDRVLPYWRRAKATWFLGELASIAGSIGLVRAS